MKKEQKFFDKFNAKKNSVIKEEHKQEKRRFKAERAAFFEAKKKDEFEQRQARKTSAAIVKEAKALQKTTKATTTTTTATTVIAAPKTTSAILTKEQKLQAEKADIANMPLNKYLAHCGVCSRRDAIEVIKAGKIKVNGKVIIEAPFRVSNADEITFNGKKIFVTKNLVYILINKPKDYISTTDDPQGRKTILQLIQSATTERVYPIGRLDRNTSGVLLLTNDGDLTQRLSHPSYQIKKIYEVRLDKPLQKVDFEKILSGLTLEDGVITADSLAYADAKDKSIIGIEIHSGRNRIVRRIFEHLGYDVKALDRVMFGNLTKKNVERGKWRFLSEKEVRLLKYLNASKNKAANAKK
jgi:23S rRNA pseudouridine2605 synthase